MVIQMRGDKCYLGKGKRMKIPLLTENVVKRSLNYLRTLERVTTIFKRQYLAFLNAGV